MVDEMAVGMAAEMVATHVKHVKPAARHVKHANDATHEKPASQKNLQCGSERK